MSKYDALWRYIKSCDQEELTMTFAELGEHAGIPLDHSFLRYKKELTEYGWRVSKISMKEQTVAFEKCSAKP